MKLLSALKRQPADNCVILTYNADLLFFEHLLFEPLYGAGCRNTLVLCDPAQYSAALGDVAQLRYAGQRYLLTTGRTSPAGAFHPKLIFLTTADSGRLIIGSGNLTRAGYTHNWEVVTLVEYSDKRPDLAAWTMCRWAFEMLSLIVRSSDPGGLAQQRLDQLLGTTQWLRREMPGPPGTRAWLLHNLNAPLLDQVLERYASLDGSPVSEAVVVSPYFDLNAQAIEELLVRCRPERLRLYTQGLRPGVDPTRLNGILARSGVRFEAGRLEAEGRRLHAKTLLLRTQQGVWLASGSANFSAPAWLCSAATGNTECVMLRHEPDPAYFDTWLEKLMVTVRPLDILGELGRPAGDGIEPTPSALTLLGANLRGSHLSLQLLKPISPNERLRLRLESDTRHSLDFGRWQQVDSVVTLEIPAETLLILERPTLVAVEVVSSNGELLSNSVLLHNEDALRRFSQPLIRRDRPRVPEGMTPESYEHCALLLEMLHDLLATNQAQLDRHGQRITIPSKDGSRGKEVTLEGSETYDPQDHFVPEAVTTIASVNGSDLYVDFYDRLTYEEVLRAAVAAAYHPAPQGTRGEGTSVTCIVSITPPGPPDSGTLRTQMLARIAHGFERLIGNFMEGLNDPKYMEDIPPVYLIELFVIITTYLRVVWRDGMLANPLFIDHSLKLLRTFGGLDGFLFSLRARLGPDEMERQERRLGLSAQTWLHAYAVAELLKKGGDRRLYDLAAWMRNFAAQQKSPDILAELPEETYRRLWCSSFPAARRSDPSADVAAQLRDIARMYDDTSLLAEITTWNGARARVSTQNVANLSKIPALEIHVALSEAELDRCFQFFVVFLLWPQPKAAAWVRFSNVNPIIEPDDIASVTIFYRGDQQSFLFAVLRGSSQYDPEICRWGIQAPEFDRMKTLAELTSDGGSDGRGCLGVADVGR